MLHRAQLAALSQMQLQGMERVEAQEKELRRLSTLLVEHQVILRSSPERPHQESPQASPPRDLSQLRQEVVDILPNTVRGVGKGQVPDLGRPPAVRRDTFEDILTDAEVPTTHKGRSSLLMWQLQHPFWDLQNILRTEPNIQVNLSCPLSQGLYRHTEPHKDLFEEGFSQSLQAAAMEFRKLREPKVAKLKGGYSSNASLVYQLWLKDIWVYVLEHHLSQWEAIQLVKDYTSEHAQLTTEYYLGLTPQNKQFFEGLIDHLSLTF